MVVYLAWRCCFFIPIRNYLFFFNQVNITLYQSTRFVSNFCPSHFAWIFILFCSSVDIEPHQNVPDIIISFPQTSTHKIYTDYIST